MKAKVARNLAKKVEEAGFHLDVGVLGAKAILNALSENGEAETAYKVAAQDTYRHGAAGLPTEPPPCSKTGI